MSQIDFTQLKKDTSVTKLLEHYGVLESLEGSGDELTGCCPLGDEPHGKDDSFSFNTKKKIFQCFACKKRGSVIDFVRYMEETGLKTAAATLVKINAGKEEKPVVEPEEEPVATETVTYAEPEESPEVAQVADCTPTPPESALTDMERQILALAQQIIERRMCRGEAFTEPDQAKQYFMLNMGAEQREYFGCIFLDVRHGFLHFERLFSGTIDGAHVYPREVVRRALALNAGAIICGHNHPSGIAEPSQADRDITGQLNEALKLVNIRLLDHIVVAGTRTISMKEQGII